MGSHFRDWIDYCGVAFLQEFTGMGSHAHFQDFWSQKIQVCRDLKIERCLKNVSVLFRMT